MVRSLVELEVEDFTRLPVSQIRGQRVRYGCRLGGLDLLGREVFSGIDELIPLKAILLVVELLIASSGSKQLFMCAALDNLAAFQHQNLIRTANRREAVGDDECSTSPTQRLQSILNQSFTFTVEAGRSLVKNKYLWLS